MYCPSCGAESTVGLNYCKRCGATLALAPKSTESEVISGKLTGLFWAIAVVAVGGLGVLMGAVIALAAMGIRDKNLSTLIVFGCMTVVGITSLLIRQTSRLMASSKSQSPRIAARPAPPQREPVEIQAPPIIASVTEHTTRQFEKARSQERTSE